MQTYDEKYLEVIQDSRFKLFGFTRQEILKIREILSIYDVTIADLETALKMKMEVLHG